MNIRSLLEKGQATQDAAHATAETEKAGKLRGGSAGNVGRDGKIYGECHRKAMLRLMGLEKDEGSDRAQMFDAGNRNEDSWAMKLKDAGCTIRREEEIQVSYLLPGTDYIISGRPDIVIGDLDYEVVNRLPDGTEIQFGSPAFIPKHGLELKGVFSHSTAVGVYLEGIPQTKHLCQAAFYSLALGKLPYSLCYTSASVIELAYWAQKKFGQKKLQPFYKIFELSWTADGALKYRDEDGGEWTVTQLTSEGLHDYYKLVVECKDSKQLGPRPSSAYATGEPLPYDSCKYCPLAEVCDNYEDDYDEWLTAVRNFFD
jgi:hypothetical protein